MSQAIIVRGAERTVNVPRVHGWKETGLFFTCRMRSQPTRACVNHWTAAENPPERVFANMRDRKDPSGIPAPYSVHFAVDAMGEVWQFCDAEARCAHAKAHGANGWSVGIEFICRGDNFAAPQRGIYRDRVQDIIHGDLLVYENLTAAQISSGIALNEALCEAYGLPFGVPEKAGLVYGSDLPARYIERYQGCLGHLHLERKKRDPGLSFLRQLKSYADSRRLPPKPGGSAA